MQIDLVFDPWDDNRTRKLFLPAENEHPMDAIARRIDLLIDARTTPDGYKLILEGGDPLNNATELDKIKLLEKSMYLIAALKSALNYYPTKPWSNCCEDACNACSLFATPYKERQVQRWWNTFKLKICFLHPRGEEALHRFFMTMKTCTKSL